MSTDNIFSEKRKTGYFWGVVSFAFFLLILLGIYGVNRTAKTAATGCVYIWEGKKWVAFGDSLTDESINADKKYHSYIAEKTGIDVVDMGMGLTGYWRGNEDGNAFYQRMKQIPGDADIITIFGSVNDWRFVEAGGRIGSASDSFEDGTLAGYVNECIDVAIEMAPNAQIALITPPDYYGISDTIMEEMANMIVSVAKYRKIKFVDLYHESGFRIDIPEFAEEYTTDFSEEAERYGHPSNQAHEQLLAPEFMELLRRMILS